MDEEEEGDFDHVYQKLTMKEISSNVLESVKNKKKYEIFKKMLERTRKGGKHLDYLQQPDASEQLPVGRVSQHIFEGIARSRAFDRYGRQVKWEEEEEEELSMAFLNKGREEDASTIATTQSLQEDSTTVASGSSSYADSLVAPLSEPQEEDDMNEEDYLRIFLDGEGLPPLQTPLWKIGLKPEVYAPIGFSAPPQNELNSEGLHIYFSYDGDWRNGFPEGEGEWLFDDGCRFVGTFRRGKRHGKGRVDFPDGTVYEGEWKEDLFDGKGELRYAGGSVLKGDFKRGKPHGKCEWTLPCGLTYEGDFDEGSFHGRGLMISKLTGYLYSGGFHRGRIQGHGALKLSKTRVERRYWPEGYKEGSLKDMTYLLRDEAKNAFSDFLEKEEMMVGHLRRVQFDQYVRSVKQEIQKERMETKNAEMAKRKKLMQEHKERMRELRLKALGIDDGEEKEEETRKKQGGEAESEEGSRNEEETIASTIGTEENDSLSESTKA